MGKYLILLVTFMISSGALAAELCLQGTISGSGQIDLGSPWPLPVHGERHSEIQHVISMHKKHLYFCRERFGDLQKPVQFNVSASGSIEPIESSVSSEAGECVAEMLKNVNVGNYSCELNVPYKWDGRFPLINVERIEF
jgi:hypothetical protein